MCSSASILLHAWLLEPGALDPTYCRFLDRHGGKGRGVIDALASLTRTGVMGDGALPGVRAWYAANQPHHSSAIAAVTGACTTPCSIIHPNQSHFVHAVRFAVAGIPAALPVYVPVYAVSTLLVQRGRLLKAPMTILPRAAWGALRSSAFLSSYCALAWLSLCTVHNGAGLCPVPMSTASVLLCAAPAGLAALLEKPSRRTELALFCAGHAQHSSLMEVLPLPPCGRVVAWLVRLVGSDSLQ
jgi:hypothetical protein